MKKISSGRRGEIYLLEENWKKIAIKKSLDDSKKAAINKEYFIIQKLNSLNIDFVPELIEAGDGWFKYYFIEWNHFLKTFEVNSTDIQKKLVLELLEKVYQLDKVGVVHWELIRPHTNVLVSTERLLQWDFDIYIIDFERWKVWDFSWTNLRGYAQWLRSKWYLTIDYIKQISTLNTALDIYEHIKKWFEL